VPGRPATRPKQTDATNVNLCFARRCTKDASCSCAPLTRRPLARTWRSPKKRPPETARPVPPNAGRSFKKEGSDYTHLLRAPTSAKRFSSLAACKISSSHTLTLQCSEPNQVQPATGISDDQEWGNPCRWNSDGIL
jgi:hypothetical protein